MTGPRTETLTLPPRVSRRDVLQAGALGLGAASLLPTSTIAAPQVATRRKSVIFVFLTGGISQQDSFDMKPAAPVDVRGEFQPVATRTPGLQICEHLPLLAQRTDKYAILRTLATGSNGHELACHMMLTGRLDLPPAFNTNDAPSPNEWPSIPSLVTYATRGRNNLPPAVVLPQPSINEIGRFRPGQYAGRLGPRWEAWHVDIAAKCPLGNGACPDCFRFDGSPFQHGSPTIFDTPHLKLPNGGNGRLSERLSLLAGIEHQREHMQRVARVEQHAKFREQAVSVLADPTTKEAFDVENADPKLVERYGKNKFGLSCLMAFRLSQAGVNYVQVNLGKNSSWDTHYGNFANLKNNLLPPMDRAVSALMDDLFESGLSEETLLIVGGEFGRTPKINKDAGRDHWDPVNSVLFAGAGVPGGKVIGKTDALAAYPLSGRQTTENFAATIFDTLGIPSSTSWTDLDGRPHQIYHAQPLEGLL
ncbi:hypothetical protein Pan258_26440 [Symmachiella dynata]|uniref:DUF1501 domain-containing protein n=1 Tax=Symmachiella dynata TaxID=2527995 RepID=UPI00118845B3|nr:DUF1501 domain-containing protein [Symmachiella dynata]QDT48602.1 hypothetical protein Pan258_26440 [Symmachiella dynata]